MRAGGARAIICSSAVLPHPTERQNPMQAPTFRARGVSEILDGAFQIIRAQYVPLVIASAVLLLPTAILKLAFPSVAMLFDFLDRFMFLVASGATVLIVSETYMGRDPDVTDVLTRVFRRFGALWMAAFASGLLIMAGIIMLVVPAFIFWAWTFAMPIVVMVEGRSGGESFERSKELAKGHIGHILGTLVLAYVIFFFVVFALSIGVGMAVALTGVGTEMIDFAGQLLLVCFYPFPSVVATLLYYDLRIRKEGFDIQMLMQQMGGGVPENVAFG